MIATVEDGEKVYVLDPDNLRLVVMDKSGKFESLYQDEKMGSMVDVAVDESRKKIYLLAVDKIWEMVIE